MILQEAIASNHPFKRPKWRRFRVIVKREEGVALQVDGYAIDKAYQTKFVSLTDALAIDWEVKP